MIAAGALPFAVSSLIAGVAPAINILTAVLVLIGLMALAFGLKFLYAKWPFATSMLAAIITLELARRAISGLLLPLQSWLAHSTVATAEIGMIDVALVIVLVGALLYV